MSSGMSKQAALDQDDEDNQLASHGTLAQQPCSQPGPGPLYGRECDYRELPSGPRHVMVTADENEPRPGLLVGWRRHPRLPWEGLVWHSRDGDGRWALVNAWWARRRDRTGHSI